MLSGDKNVGATVRFYLPSVGREIGHFGRNSRPMQEFGHFPIQFRAENVVFVYFDSAGSHGLPHRLQLFFIAKTTIGSE